MISDTLSFLEIRSKSEANLKIDVNTGNYSAKKTKLSAELISRDFFSRAFEQHLAPLLCLFSVVEKIFLDERG